MFKGELIGNLGADAEIRSGEGYKFVSMRVANSEKWKDAEGKEHNDTDWVDVVYSNTDSALIPFLKAGVKIFVRGFIRKRVFSSPKDRMMKAGITINATEIELCGGSTDEVPRQLINPETGQLYKVVKFYQSDLDTSKWKKDDTAILVDKKGAQFVVVKGGWCAPAVVNDESDKKE